MIRCNFYLPKEVESHIDLVARNRGITKSELIRRLIQQALKKYPLNDELPLPEQPARG